MVCSVCAFKPVRVALNPVRVCVFFRVFLLVNGLPSNGRPIVLAFSQFLGDHVRELTRFEQDVAYGQNALCYSPKKSPIPSGGNRVLPRAGGTPPGPSD